ncbi:hypothetical protein B4083_2051 [Bacillus cereus]|nr:hypothetical protein B4083_2051 [Bacillus cereus]
MVYIYLKAFYNKDAYEKWASAKLNNNLFPLQFLLIKS